MTVTVRARAEGEPEPLPATPRRSRRERARAWALRHPIASVGIAALCVRTTVAVAITVFVSGVAIPDEAQYIELSKIAAKGDLDPTVWRGYGLSLWWALAAFVRPLSWLFAVIGPWAIIGRLLAAVLGATAAMAAAALARRVVPTSWALAAGAVVAVLPSQVLFSSVVLRESMIWTAVAVPGVALAIAARSRRTLVLAACGLAAAASIFILIYSRQQTMAVVCWSLAAASVTFRSHRRVLVPVGAIAIAVLIPWWQHMGPAAWTFVDARAGGLSRTRTFMSLNAESAISPITTLPPTTTRPPTTTTTTTVSGGGGPGGPRPTTTTTPGGGGGQPEASTSTTVGPNVEVPEDVINVGESVIVFDSSWSGTIKHVPDGTLAVVLRPLPWESTSGSALLMAKAENAVWLALYVLAAIGLWVGRRRRDVLAYPFLVMAMIVGVAAVTQGNVGTAFRHRGQVLWALVVFAAIGGHAVFERLRRSRATSS